MCPVCGTDTMAWEHTQSSEDRLIRALGHPLSDTRMASIIGLGNRRDPAAALALAPCALTFPDVVQDHEIVRSIAEMPDGAARTTALQQLSAHPSRPIRRAVAGVLGEPFTG